MSVSGNEDWSKSVGCAVLKNGKILLAKHNYGRSKGLYCLPGGYLNKGETPQEAAVREMREELGIETEVLDILAVRFNPEDWYIVFTMNHVGGEICPDKDEISEADFIDIELALKLDEITGLTRTVIEMINNNPNGVLCRYFEYSKDKGEDYTLYGVKRGREIE